MKDSDGRPQRLVFDLAGLQREPDYVTCDTCRHVILCGMAARPEVSCPNCGRLIA